MPVSKRRDAPCQNLDAPRVLLDMHPTPLAPLFSHLVVGPALGSPGASPVRFFPLRWPGASDRAAVALPFAEAVARGASARELSGKAKVGFIALHNPLPVPVVLFQGDLVVGCKQDRIAVHTVVVPPNTTLEVEVCCVEAGRWQDERRDERFDVSDFSAPGSMLRAMKTHVRAKEPGARQERVWKDVAEIASETRTRTSTGTLTSSFELLGVPIETLLEGVQPVADQVGVVVAIGDRIEHIVVVDAPATYAHLHRRLARGHALDVLRRPQRPCSVTAPEVTEVLRCAGASPMSLEENQSRLRTDDPLPSHGKDSRRIRFEGDATTHAGTFVHVSLHTPTRESLSERGFRVRTSMTDPIGVGWVDLAGLIGSKEGHGKGRLGLTFAPGKRASSLSGTSWVRDLELDLLRLRHAHRVEHLVCLVTDRELRALHMGGYVDAVRRHGVTLHRLPIVDGRVPCDLDALRSVLSELADILRAGGTVVAHCRGGLGRAGTFGACLAMQLGASGSEALALVRAARGHNCPENDTQRRFVLDFATAA